MTRIAAIRRDVGWSGVADPVTSTKNGSFPGEELVAKNSTCL
jgi:hypothetical protein